MPNEHFCLKWNNFQRNIVAALGNLKLDEDFVDVTISCEGRLIKAHKVILSACSDYFRDLFRVSPFASPMGLFAYLGISFWSCESFQGACALTTLDAGHRVK